MTGTDVMRRGSGRWGVMAASAIAGAVLIGATGGGWSTAAAATLEELKEQGFARLAIANEPPYTEVKPDGQVSVIRRDGPSGGQGRHRNAEGR